MTLRTWTPSSPSTATQTGGVVLGGESHAIDAGSGRQSLQIVVRGRYEIDGARAGLRNHFGLTAGINLQVHPAAGVLADRLGRLPDPQGARVVCRKSSSVLEFDFGALARD
jgi:hypothetical protein